jgi:anti-anti-sigma factor
MILRQRREFDLVILDIERSVTGSDGYRLSSTFDELLRRHGDSAHFVLNLSRAKSFDSFGMAALVSVFLSVSEHPANPKVTIVNPNPTLARMFEYANIAQLFEQFADENAARQWLSLLNAPERHSDDDMTNPLGGDGTALYGVDAAF